MRIEKDCLDHICNAPWVLYGSGSYAQRILAYVKKNHLRLPEYILELNPKKAIINNINVTNLKNIEQVKYPIVLGAYAFKKEIIKKLETHLPVTNSLLIYEVFFYDKEPHQSQVIFDHNLNLKDNHTRDRCFIVASGPSINEQDLKLLKNEIVIGVSGLFVHKDISVFSPKYYVLPPIFTHHGELYEKNKFLNWLKDMDSQLNNETTMFIDINDKITIEENNLFRQKTIHWTHHAKWNEEPIENMNLSFIPEILSVSESAISCAIYMGFRETYLLGVDHNWFNNGLYHHFDDKKYLSHFNRNEKELIHKFKLDSEFQMRRHAKIFKKYKELLKLNKNIYNANADLNSYVDVFRKVRYEELF